MLNRTRRWPGLALLLCLAVPPLGAATLYQGGTLLTLAAGADQAVTSGYFLVSDAGLITALGSGDGSNDPAVQAAKSAPTFSTVNLAGRIVLPGFVSGHSHLWQSAFRGFTPADGLHAWLNALHYTYGRFFAAGDFAAFTKHGAYDQLRHGVTTTYNHSHFLGPDFALYREQFTAEQTTPQRFVFAWVNDPRADDATWRARLQEPLAAVHPQPGQSLLGLSINATGIYQAPGFMAREAQLARDLGLTVQVHYLEPADSQVEDRALWSRFKSEGLLGHKLSFAHFIHTDDTIVREAAAAGAAMIWNPLSNGRLGSGLPQIEQYLAAGLRVGMGEDGQASADISDPFENVRLGLYALRIRRENSGGLQPIDILRLHTLRTAEILGVEKWVGSLEVGKFADFLVVDPGEPGTGYVWDVPATLVFACSSQNVAAVYVGGRKVVEAGKVVGFDTAALEADVNARITALRARQAKAATK
jgi:cytosine/adenosine deaminase-related metal-dependent hydrolase